MKLSVFLLSTLLALRDENTQHEEGSLPNPDLEDGLPKTPLNASVLAPRAPVHVQRNRSSKPPSSQTSLTWMTTGGGIPSGAVLGYMSAKGPNYVCKYRCFAGFFNPRLGNRCHYPFGVREQLGTPFQILVKLNRSEVLSWKPGSRGAVPKNSVQTCRGYGVYVGRNGGGLGSVVARQKVFLLPSNGRVLWFSNYQVLTYA